MISRPQDITASVSVPPSASQSQSQDTCSGNSVHVTSTNSMNPPSPPSPIQTQMVSKTKTNTRGKYIGQGHDETTTTTDEKRVLDGESSSSSSVPEWFPFAPTRRQIERLKVMELRDACQERGLAKNGKKADLQERLMEWTNDQHRQTVLERNALRNKSLLGGNPLEDVIQNELLADAVPPPVVPAEKRELSIAEKFSSDQEVDDYVEPLINRRKALLRSKNLSFIKTKKSERVNDDGDDDVDEEDSELVEDEDLILALNLQPTKDYLTDLKKTFDKNVSKAPNNYQVKQLYQKAKAADQVGDVKSAKKYLLQLQKVTPQDTRVIRRLARLESQEGNVDKAKKILQSALRSMPKSGDLLQGLGQLEVTCGNSQKARQYFREAILSSPKFPNPYHALATLEHSEGNIRVATAILRLGLKHCPTNHRLHHALGDLYREANMLDLAEKAYQKGLRCVELEAEESGKCLDWGKSFLYTALSYVYYDKGDIAECRKWLRKSIDSGNNNMHSQGWLGLAQLEESQHNFEQARKIYEEALTIYERHRGVLNVGKRRKHLKPPKLGDKWIHVYFSYARFEEKYGSDENVNNVYNRVATLFPKNYEVLVRWATFQRQRGRRDRAAALLELACKRAGNKDPKPYRLYAEFQMSAGDFKRARSILFLGAQSLSEFPDNPKQNEELARLFHTWAIVEWHLNKLDRTESLFDHSLRLVDGAENRALVLYSIARFLFNARKDYVLSQHCICLSLSETLTPDGSPGIWSLWAKVADAMSNMDLKEKCLLQLETLEAQESTKMTFDVSTHGLHGMMRRAPWQRKLLAPTNNKYDDSCWYKGISFPRISEHSN
mmetsp:Transcript_7149/g.13562  ORF Transcript_7149/g.13562 Transcript_7149/m.13562 type:complete len:836 (-) Transcript_7149:98-2605(-)